MSYIEGKHIIHIFILLRLTLDFINSRVVGVGALTNTTRDRGITGGPFLRLR